MASPVDIMHGIIIVESVMISQDLDMAPGAVFALNGAALKNDSIAANISRLPARRGMNTTSRKIYAIL